MNSPEVLRLLHLLRPSVWRISTSKIVKEEHAQYD